MITKEQFESGYTYSEYRKMVDEEFAKGLTTGTNQSESLLEYTKMNIHRMNRLDKTIELDDQLSEQLKHIPCPINWLLITEAWCGDASQNVPILNKMAEASPNIQLRLILRDEHLDIMDQYLTDGGRAIPKLIILDGNMKEIATWGPRPSEIQEMVKENKRTGKMPYSEFGKVVQKWYATDKGKTLQREMLEVIEQMDCILDERP
ncbi:MAG: thioredoxin family protein [Flavobacteriales bacterium]|nr:thioredoxin family protein [Flavobacteriales bacterium]